MESSLRVLDEPVDRVTGLPARQALIDLLRSGIRPGSAVVLVQLDFVAEAAQREPAAADRIVVACARRLTAIAGPGTIVARYASDVFAAYLPGASGARDARRFAREAIESFVDVLQVEGEGALVVLPTAGIAFDEDGGIEPGALLGRAGTALESAVRERCASAEFSPKARAVLDRAAQVERALRQAIPRDELGIVYQPIVDLATHRIIAVEALLRWHCEALGTVAPSEFIPIAEAGGFIGHLGEWAIQRAFSEYTLWRVPARRRPRLAINISSHQAKQRRFYGMLTAAAAQYAMRLDDLDIELTEAAMLGGFGGAATLLRDLREAGVRICVDGFGTGSGSLQALTALPLDGVKLDRCLIAALPAEGAKTAVIEALIWLAQRLRLSVTAGGVERAEQAQQLRRLGAHAGQGFFFAKPMSARNLQLLLDDVRVATPASAPARRAAVGV